MFRNHDNAILGANGMWTEKNMDQNPGLQTQIWKQKNCPAGASGYTTEIDGGTHSVSRLAIASGRHAKGVPHTDLSLSDPWGHVLFNGQIMNNL